jgi:hypothetical protein
VAVTPSAVMTASVPAKAAASPDRLAREVTTATREADGTSVIRSGRERRMVVNPIPSSRQTARMPWPRPPATPMTATWRGRRWDRSSFASLVIGGLRLLASTFCRGLTFDREGHDLTLGSAKIGIEDTTR